VLPGLDGVRRSWVELDVIIFFWRWTMVQYRRNRVEGGTYFFTVTLADRRSRVLAEHCDTLRKVVGRVREARPFTIMAMVVLPEHLHAIWTLSKG